MTLFRIAMLNLFLIPSISRAQYTTWEEAFGSTTDKVLQINSQNKIHLLSAASILSAVGNKQIVIIGDQRHSVWESFAIKNYIVQNICQVEKINYLHEGSIYEFYYNDCKKLILEGKEIGPTQFKDVYFGKSLGHSLFDSLRIQGTLDSINVWGIDYLTRNIKALNFLYRDLIDDIRTDYELTGEAKIDTGFIRRMVEIEIVNHEVIEDARFNDSAKLNLARIENFYSRLIGKRQGIAEKFKKRMWRCVEQAMQYYIAQKMMNLEKAMNFDLEEITKSGFVLRDKFLFENIKWFFSEILDTTKRTIVSIATIHAIKSTQFDDKSRKINPEYKSVGMLLNADKDFQSRIYVMAIMPVSGYQGMFSNYLTKIPGFPKKSYETNFLKSSEDIFFLNLSNGNNEYYMQPFPAKFITRQNWNKFFNSVIFVKYVIPNAF